MALILRKAKGNRPGPPEWDENDYDVLSDGKAVGRIYRRSGVPDDRHPWFWSILFASGTNNAVGRHHRIKTMTRSGIAATLDEAKAAFADNWREPRA
jgi:hypothetical protein